MKRIIKIIFMMLLVTGKAAFSQQQLSHLLKDIPVSGPSTSFQIARAAVGTGTLPLHDLPVKTPLTRSYIVSQMLSPDQYTKSFGFFCQKELQIEKTTKIPIRFRLGSLDYCNKLEGKQAFNTISN